MNPEKVRNIAIIAHIDHGKTTLLDALLKQASLFRENEALQERMMDSYDQERERGITIFAKHTSLPYGDFRINVVDTPGHSDFSGEVERVLGMVNSVLLLVDAQEGPMPQTRFVLSKALKMGLHPIVVINKIDRPHAAPDRALDLTFDLFVELGANDAQLDFSYCYASGLGGFAFRHLGETSSDMRPLYDLIIEKVPAPQGELEAPFLMQAMTLGYNDYLGRQATGRVLRGKVRKGQTIVCCDSKGKRETHVVRRVEGYEGLKRVELEEGTAGDIVIISGVEEIMIGDALCDPNHVQTLPPLQLDEPTLSVNLGVNSSPFAGRDGEAVTFNKIRDRLLKEQKANISLKIYQTEGSQDAMTVCGRGELHLSVLIEAMRREGYELSVSKPVVLTKEIEGVRHEPIERAYVEVPEQYSGAVIDTLSRRKGEMQSLEVTPHGIAEMEFLVPTRGLMGYRHDFLTMTRGLGILSSIFEGYQPWKGEIVGRKEGVLISMNAGEANNYACFALQERGRLFVTGGDPVYEGLIVGENSRDNDLVVNITRGKQLTNFRAAGNDDNLLLTPPVRMTLEQALNFIEADELIEVTPKSIRVRKRLLKETDRKRKVNLA